MKTPIFDFLKGLADRVTSKAHQVQGQVQAAANHIQPAAQPQAPAVQQPQEQPDMVLTPEQLTQIARMVTQTLAPVIKAQVQREVAASLAAQPQPADQSAIIAQLVDKLHQSTPTHAPVTPPAPATAPVPVPAAAANPAVTAPTLGSPISAAPYAAPQESMAVTAPNGKVRWYPKPTDAEMFGDILGYGGRVSRLINPATGAPYYPPGALGFLTQIGVPGRNVAECIDSVMYPSDWDGGRGDRIKAEQDEHFRTAQAQGLFDPRQLTDDDLYYICRHATEMTFDPRNLGQGQFFGPDVGRMGSQKYGDGSAFYDVIGNEPKVNPSVVAAIREMARGQATPWMMRAFPSLGAPAWAAQNLAGWRAGWKRLHPGQEP